MSALERLVEQSDLGSLLEAASDCIERLVKAEPSPAGLTLALMRRPHGDWVSLRGDGITVRVSVRELAAQAVSSSSIRMHASHRAGRVAVLTAASAEALQSWLRRRPASNAEAAETGVAVVTRSPAGLPVWRVAVLRGFVPVLWTPVGGAADPILGQVQADALVRSSSLRGRFEAHGPAAVFTLERAPSASSALLTNVESLLAEAAGQGFDVRQAHVVTDEDIHAVVLGSPGATRRIAAGLPTAPFRMPWRAMERLGWWL